MGIKLVDVSKFRRDLVNRKYVKNKRVLITDHDVFKTLEHSEVSFDAGRILNVIKNESEVWKRVSKEQDKLYNRNYAEGVSYGLRIAGLFLQNGLK